MTIHQHPAITAAHARRTAASTQTKGERATFNCKAAHALAERGYSVAEIAKTLGMTERSIYSYLAATCPEHIVEQEANAARLSGIEERRAELEATPFCQPGDFLTQGETIRIEVRGRLTQGVRKADIARHLGITRQRLQYHADRAHIPPSCMAE